MIWEKFKELFHESWYNKMRPFVESKECDDIYGFLKKEAGRGKKIAPLSPNVFRCFRETSFDDLKVVMMGMCPYHTFLNDTPVADGLLMGCSVTNKLQPSLEKFYEGVEKDVYDGLNLKYSKNPDVSYLAKQGVLMVNAALTTEMNKAGSHIKLWEPFTKYLLEEVLAPTGVPYIFLGKDASVYEKYIPPFSWSFVLSHPASAAYKQGEWDTEGVFTKVNKVLKDNNNISIDWLK
jgi:uracil-DNA glycosylase